MSYHLGLRGPEKPAEDIFCLTFPCLEALVPDKQGFKGDGCPPVAAPLAALEHRPPEAGEDGGGGEKMEGGEACASSPLPTAPLGLMKLRALRFSSQLSVALGAGSVQPGLQLPPGSAPSVLPPCCHWWWWTLAQGSRILKTLAASGLSSEEVRAGDTSTQKPAPRHLQQLLTLNCPNCPARRQPRCLPAGGWIDTCWKCRQ